eukprot:NODE_6069_length_1708_cov_15.454775.p1 GENE.NODE_6069_length_1708_cov_15.454775~~NODE_6069_length_1708_cov_15.454775.p1  ORF type:complete len:493 (-),score=143.74 NODE_6069_length_1708_cov_15.454775:149-1627(-)
MLGARSIVKARAIAPLAFSTRRATSELAAPVFTEVKFQKEDIASTMAELPDFNFYVMKESTPNPYKGNTLDHSILLDTVEPKLVAPKAEFSQLENGLRIASIDKQGVTAHLGLYVHAGSRHETHSNFGVSQMVAAMAFKSTAHLSHLRTVKTLEMLGAHHVTTCKADREHTAYKTSVSREFMPYAVPLLVGNVLFPRLLPWEVKAAKKAMQNAEAPMFEKKRDITYGVAYAQQTVGQSVFTNDRAMPYFTPETIRRFMLDHFAPERMVLAGINVDHADLAKWAMRSFVDYNAIPLKERPEEQAIYMGGAARADLGCGGCEVFTVASTGSELGFDTELAVLVRVLEARFKSELGVPCIVRHAALTDTEIVGWCVICKPESAGEVALAATAIFKNIHNSVGEEEVARAKAAAKGLLLRETDSAPALLDYLGQQTLLGGKYVSPVEKCELIDGVTSESVQNTAGTILLGSKPTVTAFGDSYNVPHYSVFEEAWHA